MAVDVPRRRLLGLGLFAKPRGMQMRPVQQANYEDMYA